MGLAEITKPFITASFCTAVAMAVFRFIWTRKKASSSNKKRISSTPSLSQRQILTARSKGNVAENKILTVDDLWNTAVFMPEHFPEKAESNIRQVLWYLEQAEKSIDVCQFCLNFKMLEEVLVRKANEGVFIRILTNKQIRFSRKIKKAGAKVRSKIHIWWNQLDPSLAVDLLHHKFFVIDKKAATSGSLNWTNSGITENNENFVVTTEPLIVEKFAKEFERLWGESELCDKYWRDGKNGTNKIVLLSSDYRS